jgi:metal-responsive CopG/Arc/MetJ family transcriptional regulator
MKKGSGTKTRISLTVDKELVEELNNICKDKFMKISPFVEYLIRKGLEDYKKSKK